LINPSNPLTQPKATGSDLTQLVEQLARRADANKDGQVSTTEFAQFLVNLLQPGALASGTTPTTATSPAVPAATESPIPQRTFADLPPCPPGYDPAKWANLSHNTPKYAIGRILSYYPPTPDGLTQALPEIQKAYPGTARVGDDKIDIPDVGIVDVGLSFSIGGGVGWWWGA
jgi:hypothetical protein